MQAVQEIMNCQSVEAIAWLLRDPSRGAYNIRNYLYHGIRRNSKPTIECRQAAGTLNEMWVVSWAILCSSIAQWALYAPESALYHFAQHCELAEVNHTEEEALDVFLRAALGLHDVATYIASSKAEQRATPTGLINHPVA